ncbi:hypothetical protein [Streptomyces sp. NPDC051776]|uniref:hypothetical protein n=1 Tax=Streptomyces sp. NPDC051776 TaxID=3155414 RepID=UPI0034251382
MPTRNSGITSFDTRLPMRTSQQSAICRPTPIAKPSMAATTGLDIPVIALLEIRDVVDPRVDLVAAGEFRDLVEVAAGAEGPARPAVQDDTSDLVVAVEVEHLGRLAHPRPAERM